MVAVPLLTGTAVLFSSGCVAPIGGLARGIGTTAAPHLSPPGTTAVPRPASSHSASTQRSSPTAAAPAPTAPAAPAPTAPKTAPSPPTTKSATPPPAAGDLDAAGPDDGPVCRVNSSYSDEPGTGLRPDVRTAWILVKKLAATKGVTLCLNDGKRSRAQQTGLFDAYVQEYGRATANDLVLPWQKSAHVKGYAVDVQPAAAYRWLQATAGSRGFCRIYDNEAWHFEYSAGYRTSGCPKRQAEPAG